MAPKVDAEPKTNTFDPQRAEKLVAEMEKINEDFLAHKMAYVASCAPFQKRRADKIQEASNFGIPKSVFKAKIKERDHLRKAGAIADDFEEEDQQTFEQLTQALGGLADLPLGRAAMDAKKVRDGDVAPDPDAPKPRRGRPPKAAASGAETPATKTRPEDIADAYDPEDATCKAGYEARQQSEGCAIPADLKGNLRDRWHAGWLAADGEAIANENRKRLEAPSGITPLVH